MKKETIIFKNNETVAGSIIKDAVTMSLLALCIWFSSKTDSNWWTFFTSCMFIFHVSASVGAVVGNSTVLKSKSEAVKWANSLPEDETK